MDLGMMYGVAVGAILVLSWLSHDHVAQKLGLLLLAAWSFTNLAVNYLGFGGAPLVNPSIDALVAVMIATLGFTNRSKLALVVFLLYAVVGAVHITAWLAHAQETRNYYVALNILFLVQLLAVGGWSGRLALVRRPRRGYPRLRADPADRSGVAHGA